MKTTRNDMLVDTVRELLNRSADAAEQGHISLSAAILASAESIPEFGLHFTASERIMTAEKEELPRIFKAACAAAEACAQTGAVQNARDALAFAEDAAEKLPDDMRRALRPLARSAFGNLFDAASKKAQEHRAAGNAKPYAAIARAAKDRLDALGGK